MKSKALNPDRILPVIAPFMKRAFSSKKLLRLRQFEALPAAPGRVLFLGDSITERGMWEGWFPYLATTNRGIDGDTVEDLMARLDSAVCSPVAISLMVGTNDLSGQGGSRQPADIARQIGELLDRLKAMAPQAHIVLNSVLPRSTLFAEQIRDLRDRCSEVAQQRGVGFLDLVEIMATNDGAMRDELTADGIHLTAQGYQLWVDALRPHLPGPDMDPV